jgi:hypothetical protein
MSRLLNTYKSESFVGKIVEVEGGWRVRLNDEKYYRHFLKKLKLGDTVTVTLTNRRPKRTENQNRYYWVYLSIIAEQTGHEPEELHELFKATCLPSKIVTVLGDQVRMKTSTTDLTVNDFCEYILKIEAKSGVPAPDSREWSLPQLKTKS